MGLLSLIILKKKIILINDVNNSDKPARHWIFKIKQEKKYVPGLAFSKALSRYRTARKTGVFQQNSVPEISVNTSERASKKLKRYNINFVQQNDKEIPKVKFEDKSDLDFSTGKEISRQELKTEESSTSLIK